MAGHPDWQSYAVWQGDPLFQQSGFPHDPGLIVSGSWNVTNYRTLFLIASFTSGGAVVTINQYAKFGDTTPVVAHSWKLSDGMELQVLVPILTSYVQLTVNNTGVVVIDADISLIPVNTSTGRAPEYINVGRSMFAYNDTVPASGSNYFYVPSVIPGPCLVSFFPGDSSAKLTLTYVTTDEQGVVTSASLLVSAVTTQQFVTVYLPASPAYFRVTNTDATTSHKFSMSITPAIGG